MLQYLTKKKKKVGDFKSVFSFFGFCQHQFSSKMFTNSRCILFYFSCVPLVLFYIVISISLVMPSGKHYIFRIKNN